MPEEPKLAEIDPFARIVDVMDIETFFACSSQEEGEQVAAALMHKLGLTNYDIVSFVFHKMGARVRIRATFNRPGEHYPWLGSELTMEN
ncbi:hypothetical protein U27_02172 [Candidatus Vecturithrix granuli]|uniref:Uncharacterized protein n=1 Tax=Vecturithrix granuli TaxID=1499967 RepID=A0A0S6WA27_VECG1|nr:hypothetical protein U27_02172 [Candidatus Vecturithrix granuli]